ncbi:MAG TPA: hypothetical protein VMW58_04945 [Anaerolineae bacterium]|nr:hypothetical protein [Anaerolineae bacterium]
MLGSRWRKLLSVVAVLALLVIMVATLCGFQEQPYPPTLCEFLLLIGTAAFIQIAAGAFVSVLVEYWPAWSELPPKWKRPIMFGFCLVVPVGSLLARAFLCGAGIDQDVIYLGMMAGLAAFAGSQFAHIRKLPSG